MCYFLYIATPLTLSEVRSMLPAGLTGDLAGSRRASLQQLHPAARTVAQLLVGSCSCDLVRPRLTNPIDDERELRARYRGWKLPRSEIIKELERHRRGPLPRPRHPRGWPTGLAEFVVEHARNAGLTLYLLDFGPAGAASQPTALPNPVSLHIQQVRDQPGEWLVEGRPTLVIA
jgi:hypothetical protein